MNVIESIPERLRTALIRLDQTEVADTRGKVDANDDTLPMQLARSWEQAFCHGSDHHDLAQLMTLLRQAGLRRETVDAVALRAFVALERGDATAGIEAARRASRMARTEALLDAECVANLVLARARRSQGRAYLAARIAVAVAGYAPPEFASWLAWETLMSASSEGIDAADITGVAAVLYALLEAARTGNVASFQAAVDEGTVALEGFAPFAADFARARMVCDPWSHADEVVADWRTGEAEALPRGLLALAGADPQEAATFVVASPGERGRRFVRLAVPLVLERVGAVRLSQVKRQQGTTNIALAVLALAGPQGLSVEAFFSATYGFRFVRDLHQAVLDTLLHRLRSHVVEFGAVARTDFGVVLNLSRAVVLPDPRGRRPVDERVLQVAAMHGAVTAKVAADQLNVSVRRARTVLDELADEGIFSREREGRALFYRLDDTTFSEPTGHQRGPRPPD